MNETREKIFDAIVRERGYQDKKYGAVPRKEHSIDVWYVIARNELEEVITEYSDVKQPEQERKERALKEILQVAAVCVATLEQHGLIERDFPKE